MFIAAKTREDTVSVTREQTFLSDTERTCVSKNLDDTVRLHSKRREEWIREVREERLQGVAGGTSTAARLASSSAASFPGKNECPGTYHSVIVEKERKDSSCQRDRGNKKGEDRARVGKKWKRNGRLVGAVKTSKELTEWRRLQLKNLNKMSLPKRKGWPWRHKVSSWKGRQSRLCQKEKNRAISPDH